MDPITQSREEIVKGREARLWKTVPHLSPEDQDRLIAAFHPDSKTDAYRTLRVGPNAGDRTVHEVADLLEADSPAPAGLDLIQKHEVDLMVVGAGGAGCTAALAAAEMGARVLISTKLRMGDSNTVMAQGGMQVAIGEDDSPVTHFFDTLRGGHYKNDPELLKILVEGGPAAAKWLLELGVVFDRDERGDLKVKKVGGSSKPRLLTCTDYTGLEIMRVLKDEVQNRGIAVLEFSPVIELLSDPDGRCTGAILKNLDNGQFFVIQAKTVILATGGSGRLHIQGFSTSNHYGATGDALALAYRIGARLIQIDTFQYHPTGAVYPEQLAGALVTEAIRSNGGQLVNARGQRFINEMEIRDVVSSAIIRECLEGRGVQSPAGRVGVWLDVPVVDLIHGEGSVASLFPAMVRQFARFHIDIQREPILVYPTLHYQNGGIRIDRHGESTVKNLFVAGEASGGLHGRNRLMGNSLLDLIVFGMRAGRMAAQRSREIQHGKLTLEHVKHFRDRLKAAGITPKHTSPMILPDYVQRTEEAILAMTS